MTIETERINITIQKDLMIELNKLTSPRKRSKFINEAIHHLIEKKKQEELDMKLEEGYKARYQESLDISKEFNNADLEQWDEN